jgi:hypothetical protein
VNDQGARSHDEFQMRIQVQFKRGFIGIEHRVGRGWRAGKVPVMAVSAMARAMHWAQAAQRATR